MDTTKPVKPTREPMDLFRNEFGFEFPFMRRFFRDFEAMFNRLGLTEPKFFENEKFFDKAPMAWTPEIEVLEKENEFLVRADLPGLRKDEITVELTDEALILKGERKREKEEKGEGFFRTERTYGSFYRTIPLPEGVKSAEAKATVIDGVLEVKMPMAKVESARRRLEIAEPTPTTPAKTTKAA